MTILSLEMNSNRRQFLFFALLTKPKNKQHFQGIYGIIPSFAKLCDSCYRLWVRGNILFFPKTHANLCWNEGGSDHTTIQWHCVVKKGVGSRGGDAFAALLDINNKVDVLRFEKQKLLIEFDSTWFWSFSWNNKEKLLKNFVVQWLIFFYMKIIFNVTMVENDRSY